MKIKIKLFKTHITQINKCTINSLNWKKLFERKCFSPRLRERYSIIRSLLKQFIYWAWNDEHDVTGLLAFYFHVRNLHETCCFVLTFIRDFKKEIFIRHILLWMYLMLLESREIHVSYSFRASKNMRVSLTVRLSVLISGTTNQRFLLFFVDLVIIKLRNQ